MKKILWISRSEMTVSQFSDLKRILGEIEIIHATFYRNEEVIASVIADVDMIALKDDHPKFKKVFDLAEGKMVIFPESIFFDTKGERTMSTIREIWDDVAVDHCTEKHHHWRIMTSLGCSSGLEMALGKISPKLPLIFATGRRKIE